LQILRSLLLSKQKAHNARNDRRAQNQEPYVFIAAKFSPCANTSKATRLREQKWKAKRKTRGKTSRFLFELAQQF
jgi:hypothetical protein